MPYSSITKRKTIVQRADPPKPYPSPRNIIIQYEPPQVRVVRQFERLGVTPENPQAYIQRYGASLIDSETLLQQARAAGVIEDIVRRTFIRCRIASSPLFSVTTSKFIISFSWSTRNDVELFRLRNRTKRQCCFC